jgi:hypothetical protein
MSKTKIYRKKSILLLILILSFFLFYNVPVAQAQHLNDSWELEFASNTWIELSPEGPLPGAQRFFPHAYDSKRNRLIIAGGQGDDMVLFFDTWALDLTKGSEKWTLLSIGNPDVFAFRGGVYDSKRDIFVVLKYPDYIDVFDLNTNTWSIQSTSGVDPSPLVFTTHSVEYDVANDRYVVFGGRFESDYTNRVRVLDANTLTWTDLSFTSSSPLPAPRALHGTVYDYSMERLLLFGGVTLGTISLDDTWQLMLTSGSETWTQFTPPVAPLNRSQNATAFDTERGRMIIFSGLHYLGYELFATMNDVWFFDGSYWTNPFPLSPRPVIRRGAAAVYDEVNDRLVIFGGEFISEYPAFVDTKVDINPNTLNLKSKGKWIAAYIALPYGFDVADIDINTVGITKVNQDMIDPPLLADQYFGGKVGDGNNDLIPDLTIKFDRQELINLPLPLGEVSITISGELTTGDFFSGTDILKTIQKGLKKSITSEETENPTSYTLYQNQPNPFNPETAIGFYLPENAFVSVKIYNAISQKIRTLTNKYYQAGFHSVAWDSEDNIGKLVPSGVYFYLIEAGKFQAVKKMILIR